MAPEATDAFRTLQAWFALAEPLLLTEGKWINRRTRTADGKVSQGYWLPWQCSQVQVKAQWKADDRPSAYAACSGHATTKAGGTGALYTRRFQLVTRWKEQLAPEPIAECILALQALAERDGWPAEWAK